MNENSPMGTFYGEKSSFVPFFPVLNLPLCQPNHKQLGKYFTVYPLSDVKGLRGALGDDWRLLRTSVSVQKILHFTCARAGSLVEVMEISISLGTVFSCDWVIPGCCCICGYIPYPPEVWKNLLIWMCVIISAQPILFYGRRLLHIYHLRCEHVVVNMHFV